MKKSEVKIGGLYAAKVSDKLVTVRIDSTSTHGGWNATNTATGKRIRIKSAQRLRGPASGKAKPGKKKSISKQLDERLAAYDDEKGPKVNPTVEIITGQPLPEEAKPEKQRAGKKANEKPAKVRQGSDKPKKMSALDAAAEVLKSTKGPLNAKDLIETMAARGLWSSQRQDARGHALRRHDARDQHQGRRRPVPQGRSRAIRIERRLIPSHPHLQRLRHHDGGVGPA